VHRGRRIVATLAALAAGPIVLLVPVVTGPVGSFAPVTPQVTRLAIAGIDPAALAASPAPVGAHVHDEAVDDSAHPDPAPVQDGTGTPSTPTSTTSAAAPEAPATDQAGVAERLEPAVVTAPTSTEPFSLVAVDFAEPAPQGTEVQVRVREDGAWSEWTPLAITAEHGPDPGSVEAAGVRHGTEPLLTAPGTDGVQVRIDTPDGSAPQDAAVTLIDPQQVAADELAAPTPVSTAQAAGDPLRPAIITRAQWGADESLRDRAPIYTGPIKAGFVHHTASTSNYTAAQSTAQVRALYAYFTKGLGYSDIAYNFLVDRFGRLYEGRAGGVDKNVLGGHTAGFNSNTFAVSALGNFDTVKPAATDLAKIKDTIARLLAWKLALNHVGAMSTASLVSNSGAGTSTYAPGAIARVPAISGHRDIGSTACPGRYLQPEVPAIREAAYRYQSTQLFAPALSRSVMPYGSTGTVLTARASTPLTWRLEIFSTCQDAPVRVLTGKVASAGVFSLAWDQRAADGSTVLPGSYRAVLSAQSGSAVAYPVSLNLLVTETETSPVGPCAQVRQITDSDPAMASVRAGRLFAPSSTTVVLSPLSSVSVSLLAAPLAAVKKAPNLRTSASALPPVVERDIRARRATAAYVVGTPSQIGDVVIARLRALGVRTVVRLTGAGLPGVADAVATAMNVRGKAVGVRMSAGPDIATAAAAAAAASRRPLLVLTGTTVPATTRATIDRLGIGDIVVAGPASLVSDAVVGQLRARRVVGADDPATSRALVDSLAPSVRSVTLHPVVRTGQRAVVASTGRPVVLVGSALSPTTAWLTARRTVTSVVPVAPESTWGESTRTALRTALGPARTTTTAPRPTATATPKPTATATPKPTATTAPAAAATVVPSSFTFYGAGSGHGVGMSQYGARGMALEGASAAQIVQHFYTGTALTSVRTNRAIRVNLLYKAPAVVLRGEALASGGGRVEVQIAGSTPVVGAVGDLFTVTSTAGKVIVRRVTKGVTSIVGSGASVTVRWSGTRVPGGTGSAASLLNVASSTSGLATAGHRYRYGALVVAPSASSPSTLHAVATLRLHDEYLRGIAEVPSSWPAAALQAQVLAARTYAVAKLDAGVRSECRCHVDDGGGPYYDQTYAGWSKESDAYGSAWVAAVGASATGPTTGQVITSKGKVITAFYYAASGGRTQNSEEVWVAALPYARSVDDRWSLDPSVPWSQWLPRQRTQAQVAVAFGLRNVVRIDLSSRTAGDGVKVARAWSSTGAAASITGEQLRSRLALPSTWVWRAVTQAPGGLAALALAQTKKSTSKVVVLAPSGSAAATAIAANLGARKGWPVLLTSSSRLATAARTELVRRKPATVYVVGTKAQVPDTVVAAVDSVSGTVVRLTGATDADVSVRVSTFLAPAAGSGPWVAPANDPELLAIASAAASVTRRPFLVVPSGTASSAGVTAYVTALAARSTVVGSTGQVGAAVATSVRASGRIAGTDDADTSGRVLASVRGAQAVVATSEAPGRALMAAPGTPVLIMGSALPASTSQALQLGTARLVVTTGVNPAALTLARRA
jgi:SpoIID/LytB domain protein